MVVSLTEEQQMIRENVLRICSDFDDDYWLARDEDGRFPEDFCLALAEAGYLGIAIGDHHDRLDTVGIELEDVPSGRPKNTLESIQVAHWPLARELNRNGLE